MDRSSSIDTSLPTPPSTPRRGPLALPVFDDGGLDIAESPFEPDNALGLFMPEYVFRVNCHHVPPTDCHP
ncbi:hypothetical protein AURDEDRAFT_114187 [Auricularia subglabra TFB-10046 SS5]|nr:hypothetical protein AURDEDRAFT_114187 [Auricularia subglabra TFB-10046 SS5]